MTEPTSTDGVGPPGEDARVVVILGDHDLNHPFAPGFDPTRPITPLPEDTARADRQDTVAVADAAVGGEVGGDEPAGPARWFPVADGGANDVIGFAVEPADDEGGDAGRGTRAGRSRVLVGSVVVAVVMAAAVWMVVRSDPDERPRTAVGTLPSEVEPLWTLDLGGDVEPTAVVNANGVVVAAVQTGSGPERSGDVVAIDAVRGEELWRRESGATDAEGAFPTAITADTVVLTRFPMTGPTATVAYSLADGEVRWESDEGYLYQPVPGGGPLVRFPETGFDGESGGSEVVELVDPDSGRTVAFPGRLVGFAEVGALYLLDGDELTRIDLTGDVDVVPEVVRTGLDPASTNVDFEGFPPVVPVGDRFLAASTADGGGLVELVDGGSRPLRLVDRRPASDVARDGAVPEDPDWVLSSSGSIGVDDERFVALRSEASIERVFGVEWIGDELRVVWSATGSLQGLTIPPDPIGVVVSDFPDPTAELIDFSSGATLATIESSARYSSPVVASDGLVVGELAPATAVVRYAAYDDRGRRLWELAEGERVVAVGPDVVVTTFGKGDVAVLTGYGEPGD